jgi:hypothetical protein
MLHTLFQIRLLMGLVPFLGVVLWWGWDSGAKHYDKAPHEVHSALAAAYVPTHILGQYVKGSRVSSPDENTVVTALIDENGAELMRFVTTVTPDGTGSEVQTVVEAPEGEHSARAAEAMKKQAFTMALMQKLADEHVASAIEGRPFDMLAFNPMAKKMADAAGYGETFAEASATAAEISRDEQDAFAEGESDTSDYGEPMSDAAPEGDWAE